MPLRIGFTPDVLLSMSLETSEMSAAAMHSRPSYGRRTLPQTLDDLASSNENRLYASIPKHRDLSGGFVDISCRDMAKCVNFMAHWIESRLGKSTGFETVAYVGIPDLRSAAVFLGAVKCGYKVSSYVRPIHDSHSLIQFRCSCLHLETQRRPICR